MYLEKIQFLAFIAKQQEFKENNRSQTNQNNDFKGYIHARQSVHQSFRVRQLSYFYRRWYHVGVLQYGIRFTSIFRVLYVTSRDLINFFLRSTELIQSNNDSRLKIPSGRFYDLCTVLMNTKRFFQSYIYPGSSTAQLSFPNICNY